MLSIVKDLYNINRCLVGEGYDTALEYLKHLLDFRVIELFSGKKIETWQVPQEWVVKDAWLKYRGKKILDYKKEPLSLMVGSASFKGKISGEELMKHLVVSDEREKATPYHYHFYGEPKWAFCMPRVEMVKRYKSLKSKRKDFEVMIETGVRDATMKLAIHTIPGKTSKEVLLFAHLDHPFQANDNLSGVACLVDIAKKIKKQRFNHTVKLIICPETIGSIAYAFTEDIANVDFMMAVDAVGNDNSLLIQKSFDKEAKVNFAAHLALNSLGITHRKGEFRFLIGSDEYIFNDPKINIPGLMISRFPYDEYHTSDDKPEIVKRKNILEAQKLILKTIEIMEKDYVPVLTFRGPLFRTKFDVQTPSKRFNRNLDYFVYLIDGKKSLIELCVQSGVGFDYAYKLLKKLENAGFATYFS